jgi:phosphatidylserine decarboxylase
MTFTSVSTPAQAQIHRLFLQAMQEVTIVLKATWMVTVTVVAAAAAAAAKMTTAAAAATAKLPYLRTRRTSEVSA